MAPIALRVLRWLVVATMAMAASCRPRMPDEPHARATYASMRGTIEALQVQLDRSLSWLPSIDPGATCAPGDAACSARRDADRQRFFVERDRWARDVLPGIVRGTPVLGLRADVRYPSGWAHELGVAEPFPPGTATGTTAASDGERLEQDEEGRTGPRMQGPWLGWGLYQTAFRSAGVARGDGRFHRGIELAWSEAYGVGMSILPGPATRFGVVLLEDGFVRPGDW